MGDVIDGEFKEVSEVPKDGMALMTAPGKVIVHFFAIQAGVEFTPEEAEDFAKNLGLVAQNARKMQLQANLASIGAGDIATGGGDGHTTH